MLRSMADPFELNAVFLCDLIREKQTGYYRRWGEVNLFIIHAMSFGTPLTRLMRLVLDLLFFFCFGFLLPCCEAWLILLN